jgi:phosphoribosylaminoimidazole-succinocarboxamide synthase
MLDEKNIKAAEIIERTNFSIGQREQTDQWDIYTTKDAKIWIATDRVVAFDRIIGTVPYKGCVIAAATAFFAELAANICQTDFITQSHFRVLHIKNSVLFPVSFRVHGYINNENGRKPNMWEQYKNGVKNYFGNTLPAGLKENQRLGQPIIIPIVNKNATTRETIFAEGLVDEALFEEAEEMCLKLFSQGTTHAAKQGLILASAKYQFGIVENQLVLLTGLHIPGAATYWYANTYEQLFTENSSQKEFSQTSIHDWMHTVGFEGNGPAPPIPEEIRVAAAKEYVSLGEKLIGGKIPLESTPLNNNLFNS